MESNAIQKQQSYTLENGQELTIKQFNAYQAMGITPYVNSIVEKVLSSATADLNHFAVIAMCREEVFAILAEAVGLPLDEVKALPPGDALNLVGLVYEVNSGFFTQLGGLTPRATPAK